MYKLFGISNCSTVKNARSYLEKNKIPFEFVDFKKHTPTEGDIKQWSKVFGGLPVNKSGLTYKKYKLEYEKLTEADKIKFIQKNTSMIKRPILTKKTDVLAFGFSEDIYRNLI